MTKTANLICQLLVLFPMTAFADDLPSELLLRCEIEQLWSSEEGGKPFHDVSTVTKDYRLKNGVFYWSGNSVPIGENCKLLMVTLFAAGRESFISRIAPLDRNSKNAKAEFSSAVQPARSRFS